MGTVSKGPEDCPLLGPNVENDIERDYERVQTLSIHKRASLLSKSYFSLVASIILNLVLGILYFEPLKDGAWRVNEKSRWAGLATDIPMPMYLSTKYGPDISSQVELDRLWNAIDVGEGVITPTDEWATANGLPHSAKFPWKDAQGIYEISAFHGIHCLKQIQRYVSETHKGLTPSVKYHHVGHCLDILLQDIKCLADDTPWYKLPPKGFRQGYVESQTRQCKNWSKLLDWARERSACFRFYNATDPPNDSIDDPLEAYKYCPEGSPYASKVEDYFTQKDARASS